MLGFFRPQSYATRITDIDPAGLRARGIRGAIVDLDNTLISYDRIFYETAVERQFVPAGFAGAKREIRDRVRLLPEGELKWQRLQAHVYGPAIGGASVADGANALAYAA